MEEEDSFQRRGSRRRRKVAGYGARVWRREKDKREASENQETVNETFWIARMLGAKREKLTDDSTETTDGSRFGTKAFRDADEKGMG